MDGEVGGECLPPRLIPSLPNTCQETQMRVANIETNADSYVRSEEGVQ